MGTMYCTQAAIQLMSKELGGKGGVIIQNISTSGLDILPAQPFYNASKHAVIGYTRTLSVSI